MPNLLQPFRFRIYLIVSLFLFPQIALSRSYDLPSEVKTLTSYAELTQLVTELDRDAYFTVSEAGQTAEERSLWLIRVAHPQQASNWRVFLYAQQHGNEPAGKEALIQIALAIRDNHRLLPKGMELWLMPMVNPDGAERDQRRNSVGADLNRDHMTLLQPETQALHRAFRKIQAHLSIDCHEFGRDSDDYLNKGWIEWPDIMMDYANHPLLDDELVLTSADLVQRMAQSMNKKGLNFQRYFVGGVPPDGEQRHSAPDMDGGLNGNAIYGGLSFIIEGGVYRTNNADNLDLPKRVSNYYQLLNEVLHDRNIRKEGLAMLTKLSRPDTPKWLPTNYFWAKVGETPMSIPVIDASSKQVHQTPAPNFMSDLVIKKSIAVPQAYLISQEHADRFKILLEQHAIPYETLQKSTRMSVETCILDTVETEFDELYHRYGGRVIAHNESAIVTRVEAGSLLVRIDPQNGNRSLALLEPTTLYGLYQYPTFGAMLGPNKHLPVSRVIDLNPR